MASDRLQDVFPVSIDFVSGEMPSAAKLTAIVSQTDTAFSQIMGAIGDPWEYQAHDFSLSPTKIAQVSLARYSGPSDYVGAGGSWSETAGSITVTLSSGKNSWSLGFPLVKSVASVSVDSKISDAFTSLASADISFDTFNSPSDASKFTNEVSAPKDVVSTGDYYIDYYRGEIICYDSTQGEIEITFTNLHMLGPGVPWGTSNVIPTWKETSNLCTVTWTSDSGDGSYSYYTLTLPDVRKLPRIGDVHAKGGVRSARLGSTESPSEVSYQNVTGEDSQYRLPVSIVSSGLSAGAALPDGYLMLWDDATGRIIPQVDFLYNDSNSVQLKTPLGWLDASSGSPSTDKYRLIVTGTSLSEAVGWLLGAFRDNQHVGLCDGGSLPKTLSYTSPISHASLSGRYTGDMSGFTTARERLRFRESFYPTNEHPQYLHRYGWMAQDLDGNSANSMRGDLVFTNTSHELGDLESIDATKSYGVFFCDHEESGLTITSSMRYDGGWGLNSSYVSGPALTFPFGNSNTGAADPGCDKHGAISVSLYKNMPLFLRGGNNTSLNSDYQGAVLGLDLGMNSEANYIKLMPVNRDRTHDVLNRPADTNQSVTTALSITRDLDTGSTGLTFARLSADQLREFRFRGVSYLESAQNPDDSIDSSVDQFDHYFTSPGVVGADFLNVYSNGIFFSDTGDGKYTSLNYRGEQFFDNASDLSYCYAPTGLYYVPEDSESAHFEFVHQTTKDDFLMLVYNIAKNPLRFGYEYGLKYYGEKQQLITKNTEEFAGAAISPANIEDFFDNLSSSYSAVFANTIENEKLGVVGYDSGIDIIAYNTYYDGGDPRHIQLLTSRWDTTHNVDVGNITLHAGFTVAGSAPSSTGSNLILKAYNDVETRSESGYVALLASMEEVPALIQNGDIFIKADDSVSIDADGALMLYVGAEQLTLEELEVAGNRYMEMSFNNRVSIKSDQFHVTPNNDEQGNIVFNSMWDGSGSSGTKCNIIAYGDITSNNMDLCYEIDTSSSRYKENIVSLEDCSWVYSLDPVSYNYKEGLKDTRYGFIAEDVDQLNKDVVEYDNEDRPNSLKYDSIFSALVKIVQDQKTEIDSLKARIETLENPSS